MTSTVLQHRLRHRPFSALRLFCILMASLFLGVVGCDEAAKQELKVGQSNEEDVQRYMGKPEMIWEEKDGTRFLEYPRGPAGVQTYMVEIGPDKTYRGMKNILVPETFAQIKPGMNRDQVRRLLGRPSTATPMPLQQEEVWSWKHQNNTLSVNVRRFSVAFDMMGNVKSTNDMDDPNELPQAR